MYNKKQWGNNMYDNLPNFKPYTRMSAGMKEKRYISTNLAS